MPLMRDTTYFVCPKCKTDDANNFEEKVIVRLTPNKSGSSDFEITNRKTVIMCLNCKHVVRELQASKLPNGK